MRTAALSVWLVCTLPAFAGPLNPPAGPIAETGRFGPRIEINAANTPGDADSVYKITEPGSYYLAENLAGEAMKHGIEIAGSSITVDLNGFTLRGVTDSLDAISVTQMDAMSVAIQNGSLDAWGGNGVDASLTIDCAISGVNVRSCGGNGIVVNQNTALIRCAVQLVEVGFVAGDSCLFSTCQAFNCRSDGFRAARFCMFDSCLAFENMEDGFDTSASSVITRSTAAECGSNGIEVGPSSTVASCTAIINGSFGFRLAQQSTIVSSVATDNGNSGIWAQTGNYIGQCVSANNDAHGFSINSWSLAEGCASSNNDLDGFNTGPGSVVQGCSALLNGINGINLDTQSAAFQNLVHANGRSAVDGAGVLIRSEGDAFSVVEGNRCVSNDHGVIAVGTRNLIIRNVAADNSVADFGPIVPGNSVGSVLNFQGITVNSTNPYANLRY